jgi:hypothetical protein
MDITNIGKSGDIVKICRHVTPPTRGEDCRTYLPIESHPSAPLDFPTSSLCKGSFMNLRKLFGLEDRPSGRLHRQFPVKISRRTKSAVFEFDAVVHGYFVGHRGKADFIAEAIRVRGIPTMDLRHFMPEEIKAVKKYAVSVEYPKMLNRKG